MKSILITITLLFSLSAYSQQIQQDTTYHTIDLRMKSAGAELQQGSRQMITGTLVTMIGAGLMAFGSSQSQEPLVYIGAFTSVIGVGFTFSGFGKIGKAGRSFQ